MSKEVEQALKLLNRIKYAEHNEQGQDCVFSMGVYKNCLNTIRQALTSNVSEENIKDVLKLFDEYGETPVCRTTNTKWGLPVDELNVENWNKIRTYIAQFPQSLEELQNKYIQKLVDFDNGKYNDTELLHCDYDNTLCELLLELGFKKLVEKYNSTGKWYA